MAYGPPFPPLVRRRCGAGRLILLPEGARRYIGRIEELVGAPVGIVSTGPNRHETLFRRQSGLAAWLGE